MQRRRPMGADRQATGVLHAEAPAWPVAFLVPLSGGVLANVPGTESNLWQQHLGPAVLAALGVWGAGPWAIARLRRHCGEPADTRVPELSAAQRQKAGTPTMGGLWVLPSLMAGLAICGWGFDPTVLVGVLLMAGLGLVGAWDDVQKLRAGRGISARQKLIAQVAIVLPVAWWLTLPQTGGTSLDLSSTWSRAGHWWGAVVVLLATSNAVNLTDGLDGLAAGLVALALVACSAVEALSPFWGGPGITTSTSAAGMAMASAGAGASAAFLVFNRHPARVFLGNVGALALGGLLGYVGLVLASPWTLACAGGVFVVEMASVVLQTCWFRLRGRRLLRCAPIHHHFQLAGWSEVQVVRRFWLAGAGCLLASMSFGLVGRLASRPECIVDPSLASSHQTNRASRNDKIFRQTATIHIAAARTEAASGVVSDDGGEGSGSRERNNLGQARAAVLVDGSANLQPVGKPQE